MTAIPRWRVPLIGVLVFGSLAACTAINIADVAPNVPGGTGNPCTKAPVPLGASEAATTADRTNADHVVIASLTTNNKLLTTLSQVENSLPPSMRTDPVVDAFLRLTRNSIVRATKEAASIEPAFQPAQVTEEEPPADIGQRELKEFAQKVISEEMKPTISVTTIIMFGNNVQTPTTDLSPAFTTHFKQYYSGKYIDRFGASYQQPGLSLTVSDQEIVGAITVLVDYIIHSIDSTPVWGSDPVDQVNNSATIFYPGTRVKGKEPTVLVAYGVSKDTYQQVQTGACGMNVAKLNILGDLTGAAADAGGTLSGLVHGSFGGFEIGLGFLGKFSFGDNQTLATIVKAAASRLAARVTLATVWPILARIDYNDSSPLTVPAKK